MSRNLIASFWVRSNTSPEASKRILVWGKPTLRPQSCGCLAFGDRNRPLAKRSRRRDAAWQHSRKRSVESHRSKDSVPMGNYRIFLPFAIPASGRRTRNLRSQRTLNNQAEPSAPANNVTQATVIVPWCRSHLRVNFKSSQIVT